MNVVNSKFSEAVLPVVALAIAIERVIEVIAKAVDVIVQLKPESDAKHDHNFWHFIRFVIWLLLAIGLGIAGGFWFDIQALKALNMTVSSNWVDNLISGIVAGFIAPYAHQIIQLAFQSHKILSIKTATQIDKLATKPKIKKKDPKKN